MYFAALLISEPPESMNRFLACCVLARPGKQIRRTGIFREVFLKGCFGQLHLEDVDLVQEEDDRSTKEPSRVDDRFKEY